MIASVLAAALLINFLASPWRLLGFVVLLYAPYAYFRHYSLYRKSEAVMTAELSAGYTTSSSGFLNFPEVDGNSGQVIRRRGEEVLNDADRDERLQRIKAIVRD
ncbi:MULTISPECIES: hypothetical protein [unclassified Rathayibacter]|uniref:hypothetical protein n=1 Tax=unclassified Rathayibacter TaxID=2609250 RepID=UPI00188CAB71|nr:MULTISPECIES: hypothetical protein [unclassified Rathayibacter]MBF4462663.1 hypothetical protein [Rathayibacter sp. VKM Ac-2879]MBF4504077.1 hypothetical protein [Rathayibacter sp. VKM Ac-2878]